MFAGPGGSGPAGHPGARRIHRSVDSRIDPPCPGLSSHFRTARTGSNDMVAATMSSELHEGGNHAV
jgi:hypothetical protein